MIVILCAVMLMQALSLPPLHKRSDVLNPTNYFHRVTSLIEFDHKKLSDYRFIIEASSTKVKQCFYYIQKHQSFHSYIEKLKVVCQDKNDAISLARDLPHGGLPNLITQADQLIIATNKLRGKLLKQFKTNSVMYKDKYVAVDILATAGMRKKSLTDQTKIWSTFLEEWQTKIPKDGLLQLNTIQDTSGVEEGIYGCMIANVALGNLDLSLRHTATNHPMVGIVEIGGASAQIAVPIKAVSIKKGTNFNDFKDFHSRSIPFGKDYFWEYVMEKIMPEFCQYPSKFDQCCAHVLEKIEGKEDSEKEKGNWNLPKEILKYSHYYLLGGTWGFAWKGKKIEENIRKQSIEKDTKLTENDFYKDDQPVGIAVLEKWTKAMCFYGAEWNPEKWTKDKNAIFSQMACYTSVYAYSFLKHFLGGEDIKFYVGKPLSKPLSNSYLVSNEDVDWPSAAYLYLKSHAYDLPSSEVSVTVIKDDQYEKS